MPDVLNALAEANNAIKNNLDEAPPVIEELSELKKNISLALNGEDVNLAGLFLYGIESLIDIISNYVGAVEEQITTSYGDLIAEAEEMLELHEGIYHGLDDEEEITVIG